jgi:hypothetical protein
MDAHTTSAGVAQSVCHVLHYLIYQQPPVDHGWLLDTEKYIHHLLEYSVENVNIHVVVSALIYLSRYCDYNRPSIQAQDFYSEPSIFLIALTIADTYNNDIPFTMESWAALAGLPLKECLRCRDHFLQTIEYDLKISMPCYSYWICEFEKLYSNIMYQNYSDNLLIDKYTHYRGVGLVYHT